MQNVLVTGANGFVGTALCAHLRSQGAGAGAGANVTGAVRTAEGAAALPPGVTSVVTGPIELFTGWSRVLRSIDTVIHLAARTHVVRETDSDPLAAYRAVNVAGTRRLLAACEAAGVKRFVFVSSIKAVGEGIAADYRETHPCRPEDAYGLSKREAEHLVLEAAGATEMERVILRPPLVYGPGARGNFARLLAAVEQGTWLPLGLVGNRRSLIFRDNLIAAIALCARHPAAAGHVFHVADADAVSTRQLARLLGRSLHKRARLLPIPVTALRLAGRLTGRQRDVERLTRSLTVSTRKIETLLGWTPRYSLAEGLSASVSVQLRAADVSSPVLALKPTQPLSRRLLDLTVAAVCLALSAPLLLVAAAVIKLSSRGPALFRQERIGLHGRPFSIFKFRTMHVGAERQGAGSVTVANDPRVFPAGRLLRKLKIDELPQLLNVLDGTMSLVGPRPTVLSDYERMNARQRGRFAVKPGMTGLAQIRGNTSLTWPQRIEHDLEYTARAGVRLDLRVLLRTAALVFSARAETHPASSDQWAETKAA